MVKLPKNIEKYLQSRRRFICIIAPMIFGLILMALSIVRIDQSLSLNEARNVALARSEPSAVFVEAFNHGKSPIYIAALKIWAHCFGYTDFAMRMLSIVCGALLVLFAFIFLKKYRGARVAIPVTFIVATSPILVLLGSRVNSLNFTLAGVALIAGIICAIIKRSTENRSKKRPHYSALPIYIFIAFLVANIIGLVFVYNLKPPAMKDLSQTITALDGDSNTVVVGDTEELYYALAAYLNRPIYRATNIENAIKNRTEYWQITAIDSGGKIRTEYQRDGWRVAEYSTMRYEEQGDTYVIVKLEKE